MPELLTESFCERCGTRFTFESQEPQTARAGNVRRARILARGLKNYVMQDELPLSAAMADARRDEERVQASQQLEAFHQAFNFCMTCRQYTCLNCWNEAAGRCLSCAPLPSATASEVARSGAAGTLAASEAPAATALPVLSREEPLIQPAAVASVEPVALEAPIGSLREAVEAFAASVAPPPETPSSPPEPEIEQLPAVEEGPAPEPVPAPQAAQPQAPAPVPAPQPAPEAPETAPEPGPEPAPPAPGTAPAPRARPIGPFAPPRPPAGPVAPWPPLGTEPGGGPSWPTGPSPFVPAAALAAPPAGTTIQAPAAALWEASSVGVIERPGSGVQACVSCGLALSATARFCRRCGSRQS